MTPVTNLPVIAEKEMPEDKWCIIWVCKRCAEVCGTTSGTLPPFCITTEGIERS